MTYLDTSVILAWLLAEDGGPSEEFWRGPLASSRLLQYETWTRLNGTQASMATTAAATDLLARVSFLELSPPVLARAIEPFPIPVRTLDALHLASALYLAGLVPGLSLATYDSRLEAAAQAVGLHTLRP